MPFLETPTPLLAQRQAEEPLVNGDMGAAQDELVRRLKMMLPESIAAENIKRNWTTPAKAIPMPIDYESAPTAFTAEDLNKVFVAVQLETENSTPGAFRNALAVAIYSLDSRAQVAQQLRTHWRRAELIRRDLFQFLNGCVNAQGQKCWGQLLPRGVALLPGDFSREYSGVVARFTLIQAQGDGFEGPPD